MVEYLSDSEYAKFQEGTISGFGDIMVLRRQDKAKCYNRESTSLRSNTDTIICNFVLIHNH